MISYPSDECHFCKDPLFTNKDVTSLLDRSCHNVECGKKYRITLGDNNWLVTFSIKKYYFQMFHNVFGENEESLEIVIGDKEVITIPECRMITLDNYLEEVERAKKLQAFK